MVDAEDLNLLRFEPNSPAAHQHHEEVLTGTPSVTGNNTHEENRSSDKAL
jgi:hypothetical protein